jgi:serine/threonine protein kinase/Flp pilus assembly protein TadD
MSKAEKKNDRPPGDDELTSTADFGGSAVRPGGHVGPYKLLSTLGEGGFAVVYLAKQEKPIRRRVALKILKPGMDSKQIIARFEAERQALALLDHPNVAHVYDAGTTKHGLPYFAMEYIRGLPLTEHCDRYKLTVDERLKLFLQVCEAVQHAHHKGIIHRDIKPSNIQVCIEGEQFTAKVIDFGVAKALSQPLTERTLVTRQGQMVGTPEYMSPEQAEMTSQDIDTRTDIYSLGVLLYKLLVGTLPFEPETLREGGIDHLRQVICEESPKTPSIQVSNLNLEESTKVTQCCRIDVNALRRRLNGDLDWITMKAMEKDRTRRYQTAHALAEDIQRHLDHEPVLAGPPSKIYRLKKFLRKHRAQAVRAAMAVIILACMAVIFVMYRHAVNRAQEAEFLRHKDILSNAEQFRSHGQFESALDALETVLSSEYVGSEARLLHARLALQLKGFAYAVKELEKLIDERPEIAGQAYFLLARIYLESGAGQEEAAAIYQQNGEELLESADGYFNRAVMAGTAEKTLEYLTEALEFDPRHYDSLRARALAYYALRDYHNMELDARAMYTLRDRDPLGYSLRAIALRETGDLAKAVDYHNKAIKLSPKNPQWYSQRFETYLRMGNHQAALEDARSCVAYVENESEQFIYRFNIFTTLVSLQDYEAARREYTKIVTANSVQQQRFKASARRHAAKVLGAGQQFELPADIALDEAFSAMQKVVDYYRELEAEARRLVPGVYGQSSWSPDGKQLAYGRSDLYAWQPKTLTAGAPVLSGSGGIEIVDLESNTTRLLLSFGKDPAWSPDGKHIAFVHGPTGVEEYQEEVWIIPAKGGEPRRLAEGGWPIWAKDSSLLFYHSREDKVLYSIRTDDLTAEPERIISCPSRFPGVSPNEKYVAYEKGGELLIVDRFSDSVVTKWIPPVPVAELLVRWSPDGKELSVAGPENSDLGLWIFDVESKKAWQIFEKPAISGIWSPDGSRMVVEMKLPYEENWLVTLNPTIPTYESLTSARTEEEYLRLRQEDYTRAIKSVIEADRPDANLYLRKLALVGRSQYRIGAYEDALETLNAVEKSRLEHTHETRPTDVAFIAMALHEVGRYREAQAALYRLRRLLEDGDHPRAEKYLCETEQLLAGKNSRFYPVWECIKKEGRLNEASQLVKELQSLARPEDREATGRIQSVVMALARAYYNRGRFARHRGYGYAETVSDYETALDFDPNFARVFSDLGYLQAAYPTAGFYDELKAIKNTTRACELSDWSDYRYISALAEVHARLGNFDTAVRRQQEAIKLLSEGKRPEPRGSYDGQLNLYKLGQTYNKGNPCSFSTGRLVAWWRLDEDSGRIATDSSGSGCVGTLKGDPQWQSSVGKVGGALEFDGEGDYIEVGNESSFDFIDKITVAAWVNITTVPREWTAIVTKGNSAWRLSTCRDERKFHFAITGVGLGSSWIHGEKEVSAGKWYHVAGTYDGANVRLYVDGVEDPASPVAYDAGLITNDFNVCIGGNNEKPERCWNGLIDDVHIYNYALSQQEVSAICCGTGSDPATQKTEVGLALTEK